MTSMASGSVASSSVAGSSVASGSVVTLFITPPEGANTGPGVNRGSGGGARGCGFEERVGVHARTGWVQFI